jgi:hypothetical protein
VDKSITNKEGLTAYDLAKNEDVAGLLAHIRKNIKVI